MRSLIVAGLLGGAVMCAGAGAGAQPVHDPGLGGPAAALPVADYPEPRFGYREPPPPPEYDPYERRREGSYGPRLGYDAPPPRRFDPDDEDRPQHEGDVRSRPGYAEAPPTRPRCWIRPGYDGPERVCRW